MASDIKTPHLQNVNGEKKRRITDLENHFFLDHYYGIGISVSKYKRHFVGLIQVVINPSN